MNINELKNCNGVLDLKEQAVIKGGTNQVNTTNSIVIVDIDSF